MKVKLLKGAKARLDKAPEFLVKSTGLIPKVMGSHPEFNPGSDLRGSIIQPGFSQLSGFESQLCHFQAVRPWTSYPTSLCFHSFISEKHDDDTSEVVAL